MRNSIEGSCGLILGGHHFIRANETASTGTDPHAILLNTFLQRHNLAKVEISWHWGWVIKSRSVQWEFAQRRAAEKRINRKATKNRNAVFSYAIQVKAPNVLSFSKNSAETIAFFDKLKHAVFTTETFKRKGIIQPKGMRLNLAGIESISLPCAVVLSAELKRWTIHCKKTPILLDYGQWNRRVRSLLVHLGTLKHLGIKKRSYQRYADETFAHWSCHGLVPVSLEQ